MRFYNSKLVIRISALLIALVVFAMDWFFGHVMEFIYP